MSIVILVDRLTSEDTVIEKKFPAQWMANLIDFQTQGCAEKGAVFLQAKVKKIEDCIIFAGHFNTILAVECSRCLQVVDRDFELDFIQTLFKDKGFTEKTEDEDLGEEEDLSHGTYNGAEIDLESIFIEQFFLNVPRFPVCREDCRGLCQQCGANLNTDACSCAGKPIDPRWEALKNMKTGG